MRIFQFLIFIALFATTTSQAAEFPFQITRDTNGKIEQIILQKKAIVSTESAGEMIGEMKQALIEMRGNRIQFANLAEQIEVPSEYKVDMDVANSALMNEITPKDFDDPKLHTELAKAQKEIAKAPFFRLLADPNHPEAFDEEKALQLTIDLIFKAAHQVLVISPLFSVFEGLVDEYLEALMSRREFYQNQLVYLVQTNPAIFSDDEKKAILSSVYYSRISILRLDKRAKARKTWDSYGINKFKEEVTDKCDGFVNPGDVAFGNCFKLVEQKIRNRLAKKHLLSKKTAVAFNYDHHRSVRNYRIVVMLVKLGSKIAPIPSPGGTVFRKFLSSLYKPQRRSEGFLYAWLADNNQADLSKWVLYSSANPLISR